MYTRRPLLPTLDFGRAQVAQKYIRNLHLLHILCELWYLLFPRGSDLAVNRPWGVSTKDFITHIKQPSSSNWRKINCSFHTRAITDTKRTPFQTEFNYQSRANAGRRRGVLMSWRQSDWGAGGLSACVSAAFSLLRPQESWVTMPGLPSFQVSLEKEKWKEPQTNPERGSFCSQETLSSIKGAARLDFSTGFKGTGTPCQRFLCPLVQLIIPTLGSWRDCR